MLQPGELRLRDRRTRSTTSRCRGGFLEVLPDRVIVLADTAERAEEIDAERAQQALERASALLRDHRPDRGSGPGHRRGRAAAIAGRLKVARKRSLQQ